MILDSVVNLPQPQYPPLDDVKAARKAKKITQMELAEKIGIDWLTYNKIENGYLFPPEKILHKIAGVLDVRQKD